MHLFFLCSFAKAAWFAHPWYIRTESLVANYTSVADIILALTTSNHPHATIPNIFTFMWCLWKARNEMLFCRKFSLPHQVHHAALAISSVQTMQEPNIQDNIPSLPAQDSNSSAEPRFQQTGQPLQGTSLKSDLIIAGTKVYSDASWKKKNVPGRGDLQATGVGIFIHIPGEDFDTQIMIQASADSAHSPLVAEALALQFAARVACRLQLHKVSFLTDNLSLAKMVAPRNINDHSVSWRCRPHICSFLQDSSPQHDAIYHIPRNANGIAHNCAHQVLNSNSAPVFSCLHSAHRNMPCPILQSLSNLQTQGYIIHAILCL